MRRRHRQAGPPRGQRACAHRHDRERHERPARPAPDQQQHEAPAGVLEQDVEAEPDLGQHAEHPERGEAPQVDRHDRLAARLEPAQEEREPDAEEEGEGAPALLLDQHPHAPADEIFGAAHLQAHALVEVDDDHAEDGEPAENVERVDAAGGLGQCRGAASSRRGDGGSEGGRRVGHGMPGWGPGKCAAGANRAPGRIRKNARSRLRPSAARRRCRPTPRPPRPRPCDSPPAPSSSGPGRGRA